MADKRKSPPLGGDVVLSKRTRQGVDNALISRADRTRSLASPVMALTEAHTVRHTTHPRPMCSTSSLRQMARPSRPPRQTIQFVRRFANVALWETFGEHRNIGQLAGHKGAVTCLAWVPGSGTERLLLSGSADNTIVLWNSATGERVRRLRGHRGIVNSVACTRAGGRWASASDDGRILFWELDSRYPVASIELGYPVTCVAFSADGTQLFVGGVDNAIHVMDCATASRQSSLLGTHGFLTQATPIRSPRSPYPPLARTSCHPLWTTPCAFGTCARSRRRPRRASRRIPASCARLPACPVGLKICCSRPRGRRMASGLAAAALTTQRTCGSTYTTLTQCRKRHAGIQGTLRLSPSSLAIAARAPPLTFTPTSPSVRRRR